jgi:hypothetical protein
VRDQLGRVNHSRSRSGVSEKSLATLKGGRGNSRKPLPRPNLRDDPFDDEERSMNESMASLAPTLGSLGSGSGSGSGRDQAYGIGRRGHREVNEFDMRDDLVSWALPGTAVS